MTDTTAQHVEAAQKVAEAANELKNVSYAVARWHKRQVAAEKKLTEALEAQRRLSAGTTQEPQTEASAGASKRRFPCSS